MKENIKEALILHLNERHPEFKRFLLEDKRMSDLNTKSEYQRGFIDCWNSAIEAAALVVEPNPHVDEERECKEVAKAVRSLKKEI